MVLILLFFLLEMEKWIMSAQIVKMAVSWIGTLALGLSLVACADGGKKGPEIRPGTTAQQALQPEQGAESVEGSQAQANSQSQLADGATSVQEDSKGLWAKAQDFVSALPGEDGWFSEDVEPLEVVIPFKVDVVESEEQRPIQVLPSAPSTPEVVISPQVDMTQPGTSAQRTPPTPGIALSQYDTNQYDVLYPIGSGAKDVYGREFQDTKNDEAMIFVKSLMADMAEPYRTDSINLALATSDLVVRTQTVGGERRAWVTLQFEDDGRQVVMDLEGGSGTTSGRVIRLYQKRSSDPSIQMSGQLFCIDQNGGCENSIVEITQFINGEPCKTAYYIHRHVHAHVHDEFHAVGKAKFTDNRSFQRFMEYVENTIIWNDHFRAGRHVAPVMPYIRTLRMRSWVAAYGPGFFSVTFTSGTSELREGDRDVLTISGPTLLDYDRPLAVQGQKVDSVTSQPMQPRFPGTPHYHQLISSVNLYASDGYGILYLTFNFNHGPGQESDCAHLRISTLGQTIDLATLRRYWTK